MFKLVLGPSFNTVETISNSSLIDGLMLAFRIDILLYPSMFELVLEPLNTIQTTHLVESSSLL